MRCWATVVLALALGALLGASLLGCGGGGGSGPEGTVRGLLNAIEGQNAQKAGSYFTAEQRELVVSSLELAFEYSDKINISNVKTNLLSQTEDEAVVESEFDVTETYFGQTDTEHVEETWTLQKVDGRWLINDSSIFSYGYYGY